MEKPEDSLQEAMLFKNSTVLTSSFDDDDDDHHHHEQEKESNFGRCHCSVLTRRGEDGVSSSSTSETSPLPAPVLSTFSTSSMRSSVTPIGDGASSAGTPAEVQILYQRGDRLVQCKLLMEEAETPPSDDEISESLPPPFL